MKRQLNTLIEIVLLELRVQRRNPIWMITLAAAALLGFSEAFTSGIHDWPTTTQALRAYQLGCTFLFGIMTFLLVAGTLARDLSPGRRDLILSRPIDSWVYLVGKYVGNVLFALGVSIVFMAAFVVIPLFYGQSSIYPLRGFLYVTVFSTLPTILFCGALGVALLCLSRKVIVALPVFLLYFLAMALFRVPNGFRTHEPDVDLWDFSMRLYPRSVSAHLGFARLVDMSYSHLLQPPVPGLYARAILYTALSLVLVGLSVPLLKRMRSR